MSILSAIRRRLAATGKSDARVQRLVQELRLAQRARFDGAGNDPDFANHWANADAFDADSAHSKAVRHTLIKRARYELANNGYADGIAKTYATDLIGNGPALRMQTASPGFNRLVEFQWYLWWSAVSMRRKLWCMAHAKYGDGESFGVVRRNPRVAHAIPIDVVLHEAEQCQTPLLPFDEPGRIDGMKFDQFGNVEWYEFLTRHPGAANAPNDSLLTTEQVPAQFVLHWFKQRRPGQHRGVPEMASTLNLGAAFRRLREANLSTAEKVAAWTLFLKTMFQPTEEEAEAVDAMSQLDVVRGMMTTLPNTVEPYQLKAEHPGPTYDSFHRTLLNEQARPLSMPYNKAACDSSSYNYASGRLDHQTYYAALDVEREDCNDRVLEPLFKQWFDAAVRRFGWLGGDAESISAGARVHLWDWPKHRVADVESEANANQTKLKSGQVSLHRYYTEQGLDLDDEAAEMARSFGVTEQEIRQRLLDVLLPPPKQDAPAGQPAAPGPPLAAAFNRHALPSLNGANHAN